MLVLRTIFINVYTVSQMGASFNGAEYLRLSTTQFNAQLHLEMLTVFNRTGANVRALISVLQLIYVNKI